MHTAAKQPSETANSTPPQSAEEVLAQLKTIYRIKRIESEVTMVAAQTKAMEALIYCMTPLQSTGDSKLDAFYAKERNRQRLAATQTLLHIRTVQREKRLRRTMRAKAKAKAERSEPNRASDGSQATKQKMPTPPAPSKGGVVRSEADGHVDNGLTAPSPLTGEGDRASGRMRGRSESSDRPECGMLKQRLSMDPTKALEHAQTSLSMPREYPPPCKRSRYKTRKPKHPKQPRRRKL